MIRPLKHPKLKILRLSYFVSKNVGGFRRKLEKNEGVTFFSQLIPMLKNEFLFCFPRCGYIQYEQFPCFMKLGKHIIYGQSRNIKYSTFRDPAGWGQGCTIPTLRKSSGHSSVNFTRTFAEKPCMCDALDQSRSSTEVDVIA